MNLSSLPQSIIFDMGNVLMRYDPMVPLNAFCPDEDSKQMILRELFRGPEWVRRDLGTISLEELYSAVAQRVPEPYHPALRRCVYEWKICMEPIPGMAELVRRLKDSGRRVYVLSNAGDEFYSYFGRFMDPKELDGIIVSSEIHLIKPDPEIYRYALNQWGLKAEDCIFFDDSPANVEGAERVGIRAVQVVKGTFDIT